MKTKTYIVPAAVVEDIATQSLMNPASPNVLQNGGSVSNIEGDWTIS